MNVAGKDGCVTADSVRWTRRRTNQYAISCSLFQSGHPVKRNPIHEKISSGLFLEMPSPQEIEKDVG
jgi:hypothetical protein